MKFYIFASGSKGNATLLTDGAVHILIDLGISKKQLVEHLTKLNLSLDDLDFILLTHEHTDHTKGLENINNIDIYGGENTYFANNYHVIKPYQSFRFRQLNIIPIALSHDAHNPLGFIFKNGKEKLVYITDTGFISEKNMQLAKNADYFIIESNHNREMLLKTHRPTYVKDRIMSEFGHLSNEDCALYLSEMIGRNTKQIYLAHISMEANTYELAKETCVAFLRKRRVALDHLLITVAKQFSACEGGYED